jgi:anti-sigma-K factor RskA
MTCDELRDYYELYALGVADATEDEEIRAHLDRQCRVCLGGVRNARQFVASLSALADDAAPSPRLRRRILASVGGERRGFPWAAAWAAVAALSLFAAIYTGVGERSAREQLAQLQEESSRQSTQLARLNDAFAILNGPETVEASFGQGQPQPPRGKVFVSPAQGVLLIASNLPPAPSGKTYEMWVIPKAGNPVAAGLFQAESDGTAMHVRRGAVDVNTTGAVAVTLENEGGAAQPTSQPLIVAGLVLPGVAR